jgi:hypothetical protein
MTNGPLAGLGNWLLNPFGTALNGGNGAAG